MAKKNRFILFLFCLILFILGAPTVALYSQGYRFDLENRKITQTGGLFLRIEPKQAEININGKLIKKTDFLFGSALVDNLIPQKYKIEIKKEGYFPWEKNLEIKEKCVTEARNIVLIPENPNFSTLTQSVENFWFSPDGKEIVLYKSGALEETGWSLSVYDLERKTESRLVNEKGISAEKTDLFDLKFSEDSKKVILRIGIKKEVKYFSLKLSETPPSLVETEAPSSPFKNAVAYQKVNNDTYYLDASGNFFKNEEKLSRESFPAKQSKEYVLSIFSNFIFLRDSKVLYQFNPESKSFESFFEPIKDFKLSPDEKKLVYFSESEIWIFYLKDGIDQPKKKTGEKLFLTRVSEKIDDVFWLNSDYLIFNSGDKLKIAEIDGRDTLNIYDLGEFKDPKIFFNQTDNKLYILSEGNLYTSTNLLP